MNLAILASGSGSNFQALVDAQKKGYFKAKIKLLITDKEKAFVRKRADKFKIKHVFIDPKKFKSRVSFDKEVVKVLRREKIDFILLAGFMRIISPYFVRSYKNKIINIHPALLPLFKGTDAIKRALNSGAKATGVTVHFVDEKIDNGPIILQESIKIKANTKLKDLEKKIHSLEHKLYPQAVKLLLEKKVKIRGGKVSIF